MRSRSALLALPLMISLLLTGCRGGSDPIVGKWKDGRYGEFTLEFKADRRVTADIDTQRMAKRVLASHPEWAERTRTVLPRTKEKTRSQRITWAKQGKVYVVSTQVGNASHSQYYRIEGNRLVSSTREGTAAAQSFFYVRQ